MFLASLNIYKRLSRSRSVAIANKTVPFFPNSARVLDFGCGNAYTSDELLNLRKDLHIEGLDVIKDQNLSIGSERRLNIQVYAGWELPYRNNYFDAILACSVLHHTSHPEFFLDEFIRVIKPGGSIILVEEMFVNSFDRFWISIQDLILNKLKKGVPVPLEFRSRSHYMYEFKRLKLEILESTSVRPGFPFQHHYVFHLKAPGRVK